MLVTIIGKTKYETINMHRTSARHPNGVVEQKFCITMQAVDGTLYVNHCDVDRPFATAVEIGQSYNVSFIEHEVIPAGRDQYGPRTIVHRPKIGGYASDTIKAKADTRKAARLAKLGLA